MLGKRERGRDEMEAGEGRVRVAPMRKRLLTEELGSRWRWWSKRPKMDFQQSSGKSSYDLLARDIFFPNLSMAAM